MVLAIFISVIAEIVANILGPAVSCSGTSVVVAYERFSFVELHWFRAGLVIRGIKGTLFEVSYTRYAHVQYIKGGGEREGEQSLPFTDPGMKKIQFMVKSALR